MGITPSPILNHITRSGRCLTVCGVTSEPWLAGVWADATLSVDSRRETHLPSMTIVSWHGLNPRIMSWYRDTCRASPVVVTSHLNKRVRFDIEVRRMSYIMAASRPPSHGARSAGTTYARDQRCGRIIGRGDPLRGSRTPAAAGRSLLRIGAGPRVGGHGTGQ